MIDATKEIHSLSDFKRKTAELLARMKATGNPVVLTVKGKEELVVQDAAAYQRLVELAERAEMQEFLKKSRADADAGRTVPAQQFLESLGREA
jgi:prevent-host-death family protein